MTSAAKATATQRELGQRSAAPDRHQVRVPEARAPGRDDRLCKGGAESQNESEMADLDDHFVASSLLPAALLLQRLDDFAGHVALVVLGENLVAAQPAVMGENALDDDALAFAKQVRHIGETIAETIDGDVFRPVRDVELQPVVGADDGARFDEPADPEPRSGPDVLFSDLARRQKQREAVLHRIEAEADGAADYTEGGGDESEAAAAAGQLASPRPRSRASASRLARAVGSGASALRALISASLALSASCRTA